MKTIELTEYIYLGELGEEFSKVTIKLDDIISFATYNRATDKELTYIQLDGGSLKVSEKYSEVRQLIEQARHAVQKRCYSFRIGISNHYVPIDLIERLSIDTRTGIVTLYIGQDVFVTGLTLEELKQTTVDVNM